MRAIFTTPNNALVRDTDTAATRYSRGGHEWNVHVSTADLTRFFDSVPDHIYVFDAVWALRKTDPATGRSHYRPAVTA